MKNMFRLLMALWFTAALLVACGGGSGTPDVNTAEGYWSGPASKGFWDGRSDVYTVSLAVLENGESWGISYSGSEIYGALNGTATGSGTTFSTSGTNFNFWKGTAATGTFSGTVAAKSKINAVSNSGGTVSLAYNPDYDKSPSATNLAGNYTTTGQSNSTTFTAGNTTITSAGTFTLGDGACTARGSLSPRTSGKNVYNFALTFVGAPDCVFANGTMMVGIGFLDTTTTPFRLLAVGLKSDKSNGIVYLLTKQ